MEPKYVTFEQGKWLFEKDYPPIPKCFNKEGEERTVSVVISRLTESTYYPRPEQHQVVDWLLEKYGIWITVTSISQESWQWHITRPGDTLGKLYGQDFYSPQEAYSAAFDYINKEGLI